jgi:surface polysaccharide O-acyltransferase-like enzyme
VFFAKRRDVAAQPMKERLPFFDLIKGVAMLAVLLIHTMYFFDHNAYLNNNDTFLYIVNNLSRFAIPVFFICTGILLTPIKNRKELPEFYKKKLWRIFVPYALVTLFLFLLNPDGFAQFFLDLIRGTGAVPFYFVIVLLQLYLIYPWLCKWRKKRWFLFGGLFFSLLYYLSPLPYFIWGIPTFFKFAFFLMYGMYLREHFLYYKKQENEWFVWPALVLLYLGIIIIAPEKYYNHQLIYGVAIFNLLFYFGAQIMQLKKVGRWLIKYGQLSLWIFLVHFPLMAFLSQWFMSPRYNYYLQFFALFAIGAILSYVLAFVCDLLYNKAVKQLRKYI